MVAPRESATLAKRLIDVSCKRERIEPGQLIIHSDRGSPMIAKTTTQLLIALGVDPSYSRPHVSDDNPYSESHFKTLKYRPEFPERFGSIQDAIAFGNDFFTWYNYEHRHSSIAMLTPASLHCGVADTVNKSRQDVLDKAYQRHPERFVRGKPKPREIPTEAWINPPNRGNGGDEAVL